MNSFRIKMILGTVSLVAVVGIGISHAAVTAFQCQTAHGETPIQSLRNFFWVVTGFPGDAEYLCFHENDADRKELIGSEGLIGRINDIRSSVVTAIQVQGIVATCEDVPTTGSLTLDGGKTVTFGTASRTPPSNFPHTEAYDKKVTYVGDGRTVEFEFHCGRASMMAKFSETLAGGDQTMAIFYDGEMTSTNTSKYVNFFLHDEGNFGDEMNMAVALITHADGTYNIWQTRSGKDTGKFIGYRFTGKGNANNQELTIHYHDISEVYADNDYAGQPGIDDISVTAAKAPDAAGNDPAIGCASNYNVATNDITATDICTGLALSEHPEDTLEPGSKWSMKWLQDGLPAWMNGL